MRTAQWGVDVLLPHHRTPERGTQSSGVSALTTLIQKWRLGTLSLSTVVLLGSGAAATWAQAPWSPPDPDRSQVESADAGSSEGRDYPAADKKNVRLSFFNSSWASVLRKVGESSESKLIMDRAPSGRFTRRDGKKYTRNEAVRILNNELEPEGFRVVEKGEYLIVLNLKTTRPRYQAPVVGTSEPQPQKPLPTPKKPQWKVESIVPGSNDGADSKYANQAADSSVKLAGHDESGELAGSQAYVHVAVQARNHSATSLSRVIYKAYEKRAELEDNGPGGLPAFRIYYPEIEAAEAAPNGEPRRLGLSGEKRRVQFTVGIDTNSNQLLVEASQAQAHAVAELIENLDGTLMAPGQSVKFVPNERNSTQIANDLQPAIKQLAAQNVPNQRFPDEQPGVDNGQVQRVIPDGQAGANLPQGGDDSFILEALRGEVTIQDVPGVGLVVRGNKEDVDQVMALIEAIVALGEGTASTVELHRLQYIQSEALATLLTSVYETLAGGTSQVVQQTQPISVIPVVTPNAVLILASKADLAAVLALIEDLDQPTDPLSEFEVFSLEHAVVTQVLTTIETLFPADGPGLAPRVTAIADVRTNSLIVRARPNDMEQVRSLIRRIDREGGPSAVNDLRIIPLKNAIADELAVVINDAIQSVVNQAQQPTGGAGGLGGLAGGAGQTSQQLLEAKSAVLQFLSGSNGQQRTVRSGILADIRVTSDPRQNALIVTAPKQSMEFMVKLIEQFDQPSSAVSEIKHFQLERADATTVSLMLQELLIDIDQEQQGIQLVGAEGAGNQLIPLRVSVDVRSNSIIAIGSTDTLQVVEAILLRLDTDTVTERENTVYRLKNIFSDDAALAVTDLLTQQRALQQLAPDLVSPFEQIQQEVIVVSEPISNNLLISATPRYFQQIIDLVEELDRSPEQVLIQALLVEVELENTDEWGVELGFQDRVLFGRSVIDPETFLTVTNTQTNQNIQVTTQQTVSQEATPGFAFNNQSFGNNPSIDSARVGPQGLSNFSLGRVNGELGFGGLVLSAGSEEVSLLLRALQANRQVHILSRPQVRTLDNQTGIIQVGQSVPIVTGGQINQFGSFTPVVNYDDAGIILNVTPRISPDGTVVMEVVAEKSQYRDEGAVLFTASLTGATVESPVKDVTTATATVAVTNNQTIVLGGMITKRDDAVERKVPWLGDIPLVGAAFRYDFQNTRRTELLIFLTPRIVRNDADSEVINQVEEGRVDMIWEDAFQIHGPIFGVPGAIEYPSSQQIEPGYLPAPAEEEITPMSLPDSNEGVPTTIMPEEAGIDSEPLSNEEPGLFPDDAKSTNESTMRELEAAAAKQTSEIQPSWFRRPRIRFPFAGSQEQSE